MANSKIEAAYKQWCKETKRNGSVLVGSSMYEFFKWFEQFKAEQKQVPTDEETAIMFLDSIRDYERENGKKICYDERSSKELFDEFKSALQLTNK